MRRLFLVFCMASLFAATAFAQLTVLSSTPLDGAVGVPLSTTVSFTFSEPLDTAARFGESPYCVAMLSHEPHDSLMLDSISFSEDLTVMNFALQHTPNTDFIFCMTNTHSVSGHYLDQPFGMCYTTAAEHGAYTMSGTVTYADDSPQHAVVVLTSTAQNQENTTLLGGVIVPNADGLYTMNYVRDGVYWPIVIKDEDQDGIFDDNDGFGNWDPDSDGQGDSVVVDGANLDGINMDMHLFSAVEAPAAPLPARVSLAQNYPNPFNPETVISFTLPRAMVASVKIYNVLGREIATLVSGSQSLGTHSVSWNAAAQPAGIYFYRLEAGTQSLTQKMLLVK